jgi:hypothetical protein
MEHPDFGGGGTKLLLSYHLHLVNGEELDIYWIFVIKPDPSMHHSYRGSMAICAPKTKRKSFQRTGQPNMHKRHSYRALKMKPGIQGRSIIISSATSLNYRSIL